MDFIATCTRANVLARRRIAAIIAAHVAKYAFDVPVNGAMNVRMNAAGTHHAAIKLRPSKHSHVIAEIVTWGIGGRAGGRRGGGRSKFEA